MKNFLVTHEAVIGRAVDQDHPHPTVQLTFYSLHEGTDTEEIQSQVTQYSDPVFKTKVLNIAEIGDVIPIEELKTLLDIKTVLTEP